MVSSLDSTIATLTPDSFRIHTHFKVIELIIALETKHEKSNSLITIYEYLIADDTGCIILNTKTELETNAIYEIKDGHTRIIEGFLRLYSNQVESSTLAINNPNTQNNRSLVQLERKI